MFTANRQSKSKGTIAPAMGCRFAVDSGRTEWLGSQATPKGYRSHQLTESGSVLIPVV